MSRPWRAPGRRTPSAPRERAGEDLVVGGGRWRGGGGGFCAPGRGWGAARLVRAGAGYRLAVRPGELDVAVFTALAGRGRTAVRAGDAAAARELLGQALGLWRGAALADAAPLCPRLAGEAARLEEARL